MSHKNTKVLVLPLVINRYLQYYPKLISIYVLPTATALLPDEINYFLSQFQEVKVF